MKWEGEVMETGMAFHSICDQFANILHGKGKTENGVCTVSFHRSFDAKIEGENASSILGVDVTFQSLDQEGNALNLVEVAILQEELPAFTFAATQQGIVVGAIHNHWLFTKPQIMYIHLQSIEPPLQFAEKIAYAFTQLNSLPVPKK